jgi:hypothetical protein
MLKLSQDVKVCLVATMLAVLLAGCGGATPPTTPASAPAAAAQAHSVPVAAPVASPAAGTVSAPDTSTPVVVSAAAPKPGNAGPELASMTLATAPAKLSVPVDLRFQFEGDASGGLPVTLHLAAVPRVAGSNLKVSIKEVPGLQTSAITLGAQKASAATAYRQQVSVTKLAGGPSELRVLVTMDVGESSAFGWFGVPFGAAPAPRKQDSMEQR